MSAELPFAWLATYSVHSTLLLCAAWVLARLCHRPDVRHALWKVATTGAVISATLQMGLGARPAEAAWRGWSNPATVSQSPRADDAGHFPAMWVSLWASGALLGVAVRERRRRIFWHALTNRRLVDDAERTAEFRALCVRFGLRREVRLTASRRLLVPAALGRAEVCVPEPAFWLLSPAQRESVLAHELAHVERADPLWRAAAELVAAIFFFQPLHRRAASEMHAAAELACDDRVVLRIGNRRSLVESLAYFATCLSAPPAGAAAYFGGEPSPLILRVQRVLDPGIRRPADAAPRALSWGGACAVLALAALGPGMPPPAGMLNSDVVVLSRGVVLGADGYIERITPGGSLSIATHGFSGERRLDIWTARDGKPLLRYSVNGEPAEFDSGARDWAARLARLP